MSIELETRNITKEIHKDKHNLFISFTQPEITSDDFFLLYFIASLQENGDRF